MFSDRPFEQRLAVAGQGGVRFVEIWFVDCSFHGSGRNVAAMAERYGVQMTHTVVGSPGGILGGGLTDPRHRDEWLDRVRMTIAFHTAGASQ